MLFATASQWVHRLTEAHTSGRVASRTRRASGYPLLMANLVLPTGQLTLQTGQLDRHLKQGVWPPGEVFGDEVVATAMIDRLVHKPTLSPSMATPNRLKDRGLGRVPSCVRGVGDHFSNLRSW